MFHSQHVECYLARMTHRVAKNKSTRSKVTIVDLGFEVRPLTPALAGELGMKARLFSSHGEVLTDTDAMVFNAKKICPKEQLIELWQAPDMPKASWALEHVQVKAIRAAQSGKASNWTLYFTVTFENPSRDDLAYLNAGLTEKHYLTFFDAAPRLTGLDETVDDNDDDDDDLVDVESGMFPAATGDDPEWAPPPSGTEFDALADVLEPSAAPKPVKKPRAARGSKKKR